MIEEDGVAADSTAKDENSAQQEEKAGEEYWKIYCDEQHRPTTDFAALIDTIRQEAKANLTDQGYRAHRLAGSGSEF
jgi:hypothetical protein